MAPRHRQTALLALLARAGRCPGPSPQREPAAGPCCPLPPTTATATPTATASALASTSRSRPPAPSLSWAPAQPGQWQAAWAWPSSSRACPRPHPCPCQRRGAGRAAPSVAPGVCGDGGGAALQAPPAAFGGRWEQLCISDVTTLCVPAHPDCANQYTALFRAPPECTLERHPTPTHPTHRQIHKSTPQCSQGARAEDWLHGARAETSSRHPRWRLRADVPGLAGSTTAHRHSCLGACVRIDRTAGAAQL